MADPVYIREDMALITLSFPAPPPGYAPPKGYSWSTYSGGELAADNAKTRPGGMGREVSAGGPGSRGDVTLTTQLTDLNWAWIDALDGVVGSIDAKCVIGVNYKPGRAAVGAGFTRNGMVTSVNPPDFDSNGNEVTFLEVVISCNE